MPLLVTGAGLLAVVVLAVVVLLVLGDDDSSPKNPHTGQARPGQSRAASSRATPLGRFTVDFNSDQSLAIKNGAAPELHPRKGSFGHEPPASPDITISLGSIRTEDSGNQEQLLGLTGDAGPVSPTYPECKQSGYKIYWINPSEGGKFCIEGYGVFSIAKVLQVKVNPDRITLDVTVYKDS